MESDGIPHGVVSASYMLGILPLCFDLLRDRLEQKQRRIGLKSLQSISYRPWPLTLRALGRKRHKRGGGAFWRKGRRPRGAEINNVDQVVTMEGLFR